MRKVFYSGVVVIYALFTIVLIINIGRYNYSVQLDSDNVNSEKSAYDKAHEEQLDKEDSVVQNSGREGVQNKEEPAVKEDDTDNIVKPNEPTEEADLGEEAEDIKKIAEEAANKREDDEAKEDKEILKVPARDIIGKLSVDEKLKLLAISRKLDKGDYEKIAKFLKSGDTRYALENTLYILERELSDEDLEEIKVILSEYIDFESI